MLSKGRANDLLLRPLQETDLLLHEAGVPPLHTTFAELQKLPHRVKKRMYVVHSSTIPEEFGLRKAPTGTAGTLRLDELQKVGSDMDRSGRNSTYVANHKLNISHEDDEGDSSWDSAGSEYERRSRDRSNSLTSSSHEVSLVRNSMVVSNSNKASSVPLVSLRPTSNTDSWYILNLLQAVPFLTRYVKMYLL